MEGIFSGYAKTTKTSITDEERQMLPHFMQEAALRFVFMRCKNERGPLPLETELSALNWLNEHQIRLNIMVNENFVN